MLIQQLWVRLIFSEIIQALQPLAEFQHIKTFLFQKILGRIRIKCCKLQNPNKLQNFIILILLLCYIISLINEKTNRFKMIRVDYFNIDQGDSILPSNKGRLDGIKLDRFLFLFCGMGASCLSGSQSTRQIQKSPQKIASKLSDYQIQRQSVPESAFETPKKKSQPSPQAAFRSSVENISDKFNPEDVLISPKGKSEIGDSQQDTDILMESLNMRSSIIRLPSKLRKSASGQVSPHSNRDVLQDFQKCQAFEGELKTEKHEEVITIKNAQLDIQFLLPRCRAGPIIVPYVDYDKFTASQ